MASTRDRILTATNELFRRHGFNGTSIKQVTLAAQVPMGSLYHFFPNGKDQLAQEAIETSGPAYEQLFEMIATEAESPLAAISDFFDGAAEVLMATDFIDICPIGTIAREVASTNEALRESTWKVFSSWIAAAAAHFEAAGVPAEEARQLATTVVAALEGGFMLARAARDTAPLRAIGAAIVLLVATTLATSAAAESPSSVSRYPDGLQGLHRTGDTAILEG
jgi:AcrR family transcriptional regulator